MPGATQGALSGMARKCGAFRVSAEGMLLRKTWYQRLIRRKWFRRRGLFTFCNNRLNYNGVRICIAKRISGNARIVNFPATMYQNADSGVDDAVYYSFMYRPRTRSECRFAFSKTWYRRSSKRNTLMKKIGLIVTACVVAAVSWYWIATRPPYPILDSGYWVGSEYMGDRGLLSTIHWMDDRRIIFTGGGSGAGHSSLYIWDTLENKTTLIRADATGLCYSNGYVRYLADNLGQQFGRQGSGPIDAVEEKPFVMLKGEAASYTGRNQFTCRDFDRRQLPGYGDDMARLPLRDGHGFLEVGKKYLGSYDMPLRLFPPGNTTGIELPLKQWQVTEKPVTYVEFANAYLMYAPQPAPRTGITTWPKNQPYPVHFLSPDGTVRTVNIPYIKGMSGLANFWAVRDGILVSIGAHPRRTGTYFVPNGNGQPQRVINGIILPATVSPDGCKLAFNHSPYNDKVRGGLKIINFCK